MPSSKGSPHVVAESPPGWSDTTIAPPPIAANAGAEMTQWSAKAGAGSVLLTGCVATPIPGWVDDMRPAVEARTVALAGKATGAITNRPMDARAGAGDLFALRAASDLDGPVLATARTFIGFDESRVHTCFVTCTGDRCASSVAGARLEGSLPPPRPGLGLRAVTWAVHHPRETAATGAATIAVVAFLAVILRRRPRFSG